MTAGEPIWEDGAGPAFPPLEEDVSADVAVVGLGGSGLAAVAELRRAGASVVGVDAGPVAGGAAGSNGGFLLGGLALFHHDAVDALGRARAARAYRLTLDEMDRMAAETPDLTRRCGSLRIATSEDEEADVALQLAALEADGIPAQPYAGPEGTGLLLPSDAAFNPLARCRALATAAEANGARLFEHTQVTAVTTGRVRCATGATIRCDSVLVLTDAGVGRIVPALADRVRVARLQMLGTGPTTEVALPRPVYARFGWDYWQQLDDGRVALGGGRDLVLGVQAHLEHLLREVIGVVVAPITHRWSAVAGFTTDRLPVTEQPQPRVWVAGGYSGMGNVIGSMCGRALAQLAIAGTTDLLP